jgi:cob(I)alamin adenosyltransferase
VPDPQWTPIRVTPAYTARLEQACDRWNAELPKLDSFILPGGTKGSALLQVALTVVRRAERRTWALLEEQPEATNKEPVLYLNRLSDLLFILSRVANRGDDVLWVRGAGG